MFKYYVALVFLHSGLYQSVPENGVLSAHNAKKLRSITVNGHRYRWHLDQAYRLIGWYPWQMPTMNPFKFLYQWIERRFVSVGLLLYHEPEDVLHSTPYSPDEVLDGPLTFSNYVAKGYDRVTPALFRTAIKSPLIPRYRKKPMFGVRVPSKTVALVIIAVVILLILYFSGAIGRYVG